MGRFALLAAFLLLFGCQTLDEIRDSTPVRAGRFSGNYIDVGSCATRSLLNTAPASMTVDRDGQVAVLTRVTYDGWVRRSIFEATLRQDNSGGGTVEMRSAKTVWNTPFPDADIAWNALEGCGRAALSHQATPSQR